MSCGPSPAPDRRCAVLAAPSSARCCLPGILGSGCHRGHCSWEGREGVHSFPRGCHLFVALVHFPGWPASQANGRQSSASSLAKVCIVPLGPPVTPACKASDNSARRPWSCCRLKPQQGCGAVLSWDSWTSRREVKADLQTSPVADISSELL